MDRSPNTPQHRLARDRFQMALNSLASMIVEDWLDSAARHDSGGTDEYFDEWFDIYTVEGGLDLKATARQLLAECQS